ncbi:geranylgeranyl transferase type-2 subunit beta-like isoform X2 [Zophobas morio]|uniref:geranylgeranyl transferase type-2 subunit beta-like isoform X2 n=1 Tax=Zophobas morio TaxID=2755281 RepID=UPI003082E201
MEKKDIFYPDTVPILLYNKHIEYLKHVSCSSYGNSYDFKSTESIRMSGIYWCLTALDITHSLKEFLQKPANNSDSISEEERIVNFLLQCYNPDGGFGAAVGHDSHMLYTLSAVQILVLLRKLDLVDKHKIARFISTLQQVDGSFAGDNKYSEIDSRFSFCAIACLYLLSLLDAFDLQKHPSSPFGIDTNKAVDFVLKCQNFDGGFGTVPGSESHAGQVYCCIGVLTITRALHKIDTDLLAWWLCERQLPSGGLNGRPEKLPDVCYCWWVLSSLKMLGRLHWINKEALIFYIRACQDPETGGISDRPGDCCDPFHTLFGLAGLQLLGAASELQEINAVFCLPQYVVDAIEEDCCLDQLRAHRDKNAK